MKIHIDEISILYRYLYIQIEGN